MLKKACLFNKLKTKAMDVTYELEKEYHENKDMIEAQRNAESEEEETEYCHCNYPMEIDESFECDWCGGKIKSDWD